MVTIYCLACDGALRADVETEAAEYEGGALLSPGGVYASALPDYCDACGHVFTAAEALTLADLAVEAFRDEVEMAERDRC